MICPDRWALSPEQIEWALLKIREGYKSEWICKALHIGRTNYLVRYIQRTTGCNNLKEYLEEHPPIELKYEPVESHATVDCSWKMP